jgi:hypothetical protein
MCGCSKLATKGRKIDPSTSLFFFFGGGFWLTQFVMTGKDRQSGRTSTHQQLCPLPPPINSKIETLCELEFVCCDEMVKATTINLALSFQSCTGPNFQACRVNFRPAAISSRPGPSLIRKPALDEI